MYRAEGNAIDVQGDVVAAHRYFQGGFGVGRVGVIQQRGREQGPEIDDSEERKRQTRR